MPKKEYSASYAPLYSDGTEGDRFYAWPATSWWGAMENLNTAIETHAMQGNLAEAFEDTDAGIQPDALDITLTWKVIDS